VREEIAVRMRKANIYPVILAAGHSVPGLFAGRGSARGAEMPNPFEIAAANCAGLRTPVIVLGYEAVLLARYVPRQTHVAINPNWGAGQISSLLAGLRRVPRGAAFMIYPVDLVFLKPALVQRLVQAFVHRPRGCEIMMPRYRGRTGHPVIFSGRLRDELRRAATARDVVYRVPRRLGYVPVRSTAIWKEPKADNSIEEPNE
jgi:CTP:molybdopterin cytidylyltransferase MocA